MQSIARFLLLFFRGIWCTYGNVGITPFFFEASSEIIVPAVYGAGSAGTLHEIVPVLGFDFVTADVTADSIFDDHWDSSFVSSADSKTPIRIPSINPDVNANIYLSHFPGK